MIPAIVNECGAADDARDLIEAAVRAEREAIRLALYERARTVTDDGERALVWACAMIRARGAK